MKLRRKCIHREDARRTVQPRDCSETTMLFMLSILGFRLFSQATLNRRFTQYQKFQFLIRMLQPSRKYSHHFLHVLQPQESRGGSTCILDYLEALRSGILRRPVASQAGASGRSQSLRRVWYEIRMFWNCPNELIIASPHGTSSAAHQEKTRQVARSWCRQRCRIWKQHERYQTQRS